jgi:hypothetical protein
MLEGGLSAGTLKGIYFDNNKFELKKELCQNFFIIYEIRHWFRVTPNHCTYNWVLKYNTQFIIKLNSVFCNSKIFQIAIGDCKGAKYCM